MVMLGMVQVPSTLTYVRDLLVGDFILGSMGWKQEL